MITRMVERKKEIEVLHWPEVLPIKGIEQDVEEFLGDDDENTPRSWKDVIEFRLILSSPEGFRRIRYFKPGQNLVKDEDGWISIMSDEELYSKYECKVEG